MSTIIIFLSSGLFLGWSLGANDAANVWGTAVGTRMVSFKKAALPVSTSQAIVGAIIGWNFFSGSVIDMKALTKIVGTWVFSPVLSAIIAIILYFIVSFVLKYWKVHLIRLDGMTRIALLAAGAFGSYSLGANNIANVMGVFVESAAGMFKDISFGGVFTLNGVQQLFFIGGIAFAVGVFTYSKKVMMTVGAGIYELSPITAFIVVLSSSIVLFLFASKGLKDLLVSNNLPSFPLVPVSSSQSIVGAVIGIGIAKGGRNLNLKILGRISAGWIATPVIAAAVAFIALFIVQNVFSQVVF